MKREHFDRLVATLRKSVKWLILAAILALLVYRVKLAPMPVQVHEVQAGPVVAEVMGTGTLEARVKTTISPRIQERLAGVLVDQGDAVSAGQLLARLDEGEIKRQVEVAEAALGASKATANRVRADEVRAQAVQLQALQEHQRVSDLLESRISSQSEMDKAIEQLHIAESDLQRARAAKFEAQQQVVTAERNLAFQRERLEFTRLVSPFDGLITRRDRDPGGVVVPGSSILQLIATNELWISAWVDETASSMVRPGQTATVVFRSEPDLSRRGEVARLGRETDRETREFLVDVRVDELPANWTIGQRAEVFIETGRRPEVLAIPQQFLQWRSGRSGVFVAEGGRAVWRDVGMGLQGRGLVEITRGLSAGEKVVVQSRTTKSMLKDGQRIAFQ